MYTYIYHARKEDIGKHVHYCGDGILLLFQWQDRDLDILRPTPVYERGRREAVLNIHLS